MADEITRAGNADRHKYLDHLPWLCAHGYITEDEMDEMGKLILAARDKSALEKITRGLPKPTEPLGERDWGVPHNFVPAAATAVVAGFAVAILPAVWVPAHHGPVGSFVIASTALLGVAVILLGIVVICCASATWTSQRTHEKQERLERHARRQKHRKGK